MSFLSVSSRSSVNRAPARCLGGHGFDSCRGLFFLSHTRVMLTDISYFTRISFSQIQTIYLTSNRRGLKYPMPIVIGLMQAKTSANGSNIAKHAWSFDHRIYFDNSSVIDKGSFRITKTLEAWHTSATKHADNNFKPIPNQYSILFKQ